jgi:type I restriction enzyme S subunit
VIGGHGSYPAMKASGVPWLGDVPAHWRLMPGRACYREKKIPNTGLKETRVLSLSFGRIVVKPEEKLHGLVPASFETYQMIEPGDIIVRPTDLQNDWNSLRFGLSRDRGIITSAYLCFRTQDVMGSGYGFLLLHAYDLKKIFYGLGSGLRQNLDWGDFKYLPCLVPPDEEQSAIARFVTHADHRVRCATRAKKELIALLSEQKQSILGHALTRGIDPSASVKSSGLEWLGDVPAHWDVVRLKNVLHSVDMRSTTGVEELLSLRREHGVVIYANHFSRPPQAATTIGFKLVQPGQLVVNRLQANNGLVFHSELDGVVSPDYSVFAPKVPLRIEYLSALLRTMPYRAHFRREAKGLGTGTSGFLRLYDERLLETRVALPPVAEQAHILQWLSQATADLDHGIAAARREVTLLDEFRASLIVEVVAGRVDVREAAAFLPDEAEEPARVDDVEIDEDTELETALGKVEA